MSSSVERNCSVDTHRPAGRAGALRTKQDIQGEGTRPENRRSMDRRGPPGPLQIHHKNVSLMIWLCAVARSTAAGKYIMVYRRQRKPSCTCQPSGLRFGAAQTAVRPGDKPGRSAIDITFGDYPAGNGRRYLEDQPGVDSSTDKAPRLPCPMV